MCDAPSSLMRLKNTIQIKLLVFLWGWLVGASSWAQSAASVTVKDAWLRATVGGQTTAGAFMVLTASTNVTLLGASSPLATHVEFHEMTMDAGMMRMRARSTLELLAGKPLVLKPGSYHVMLSGLRQPLKSGEKLPLLLHFEGADKKPMWLTVRAEVRDLTTQTSSSLPHHH